MTAKNPEDEKLYTVYDIAELWGVSRKTVTKLFRHEPGVLAIPLFRSNGVRHERFSLRIPASVLERVRKQLTR